MIPIEKMRVSKSEKQKLEIERKLKELQKSTPPSKKIGFTKMFAVFILLMNTILFAFALFYAWTYHDVSFIERLMIVWGGEMSIITGFIVWKSKQENITKIKRM